MAGDPAELAYGHALTMLGDPVAAEEVATTALRRAGRARSTVLAHARSQSVARASADEPVDLSALQTVVLDLPALAATLASTRPPEERAALDLRARTGGDLAALGEAFGARPTSAANRCNAIAEEWDRTLDPALVAFSGAGECEGLSAVLDGVALDTVADLMAIAPAVHDHAQGCIVCTDRVRAMAPVRSFFSGDKVEVPDSVRDASRISRTKRPSAEAEPLFAADAATRPRRIITPLRVGALLAAAAIAIGVVVVASDDSSPSTLTRLTRLNKTDALAIDPPDVNGLVATMQVRNPTDKAIAYTATASETWAEITPARATVAPHGVEVLTVTATDAAPEGNVRASVTVTTTSGANTVEEIAWDVEHAPDLAASAVGCDVKVNVVEEGDLHSLVLHWRDTAEHEIDITEGSEGYNGQLTPEGGQPITYWVTATDARGNQARTPDQMIAADAC